MNTRAALHCFDQNCGATYAIDELRTTCSRCGNLLEVCYDWSGIHASELRKMWEARKTSREPADLSGVWRFREMIPFLPPGAQMITMREGNTPLLDSTMAAEYGGVENVYFKQQGFNPTGSFKDNGMTAGVSQAAALGKQIIACVSTGNTSASLAAYAARGGLKAVIFIPAGQIAAGKLAQALEYGALTIQVQADFDITWKLIVQLVDEAGMYLLNSVNPFRIEGQKMIPVEMMEQLGWQPPDWIVLPGGNLGNSSAFGKGLREMRRLGLIDRLPRLAVIQAEGSSPLYNLFQRAAAEGKPPREMKLEAVANAQTLATAIKIGAPASWKKAIREIEATRGVVEKVSEQEIADAKAVIGRAGIGCEPASAATLAGIRKLAAQGVIDKQDRVVAVLTGNVLKDPGYTLAYHEGKLSAATPQGPCPIVPNFGNQPFSVAPDKQEILRILQRDRDEPTA